MHNIGNIEFNILIIDDEKGVRGKIEKLINIFLEKNNFLRKDDIRYKKFSNAKDATFYIQKENRVDIVLLDIHMTNGEIRDQHLNGDQFLKNLNDLDTNIPVIIVSTESSDSKIIDMKKLGAIHFIKKNELFGNNDDNGNLSIFYKIFELKIQSFKTEVLLIEKQNEVKKHAYTDYLTKLYRRDIFNDKFDNIKMLKIDACALLLDIDNFKSINDTYGHNFGDEVLKTISSIILNETRNQDTCIRWGGEEFLILINSNLEISKKVSERIRLRIDNIIIKSDNNFQVDITISGGLTEIDDTTQKIVSNPY